MSSARELKDDIRFNAELGGLLDVMKNIAVFQFRSLQRKTERFEEFSALLRDYFRMIQIRRLNHPYIHPKTERPCVLMVTSDEGFMGGLNFKVINAALGLEGRLADVELAVVGERGSRYLAELGRQFREFPGVGEAQERFQLAAELKDYILKGFWEGRFGKAVVYYPKPISFMTQEIKAQEILPSPPIFGEGGGPAAAADIIVESPMGGIVEFLIDQFVTEKMVEIFEDSKLSEYAARAMHLEESGQELTEKRKKLNLQYFHVYHELIDKCTRELFSAQLIIKKN